MRIEIKNVDSKTSPEAYRILAKIIEAIDKEGVKIELSIDALAMGSMASIMFCIPEDELKIDDDTTEKVTF